jgi:hypothetical protein
MVDHRRETAMIDDALQERLEQLTSTCAELAAEVWVLRDRLTIVEHLLERRCGLSRAEIDAFQPDGALAAELAAARSALAERVLPPAPGRTES